MKIPDKITRLYNSYKLLQVVEGMVPHVHFCRWTSLSVPGNANFELHTTYISYDQLTNLKKWFGPKTIDVSPQFKTGCENCGENHSVCLIIRFIDVELREEMYYC